ncbi:MAG: SAM-dependent methyltransferase, MidA family [Chloroflexi bacterium]|jgi:SAM-dependent MidA family methyltransferase|nr:MAG: SAM-dependent methyltransferase, MidA family [Chloroflexota bacterium]
MTEKPEQHTVFRRIADKGKITFAEFMESALYSPLDGYYFNSGRDYPPTDYFTSPMAHPTFAALIAVQLEEMWTTLGNPSQFTVIEQGAGSGHLGKYIRQYANNLDPSFNNSLNYIELDRSFGASSLDLNEVAPNKIIGCIISNELLDAFPFHRVKMEKGQLQEIYVTTLNGSIVEVLGSLSQIALQLRLQNDRVDLKEGQIAEISLNLDSWVQDVSNVLESGFVITIDYGSLSDQLYNCSKMNGTLQCYSQHTANADPYQQIGNQDITAHVDFSAVISIGKQFGLASYEMINQRTLLDNLGLQVFIKRLNYENLSQQQRDINRLAMLALTRPDGLGDFKVLIQSKNVTKPKITGLTGNNVQLKNRLLKLPLPLLEQDHINLLESRYPHAHSDSNDWWSYDNIS